MSVLLIKLDTMVHTEFVYRMYTTIGVYNIDYRCCGVLHDGRRAQNGWLTRYGIVLDGDGWSTNMDHSYVISGRYIHNSRESDYRWLPNNYCREGESRVLTELSHRPQRRYTLKRGMHVVRFFLF